MQSDSGKFPHQRAFLTRLENKLGSRRAAVDAVADTLGLSRDAAYRRFRGQTALSVDAMVNLAAAYGLSPGGRQQQQRPTFPLLAYPMPLGNMASEVEFVETLAVHTGLMAQLPGGRISYSSPELPIIHEFLTPVLRDFKIYVYGSTVWGLDKFRDQPFERRLIDPRAHQLGEETVRNSYRLEGREVWSVDLLGVTLRQISYVYQMGRFRDASIVRELFSELHAIVDHLERMSLTGRRFHPSEEPTDDHPPFTAFLNELSNNNGTVLIEHGDQCYFFGCLLNPNYVMSRNQEVCRDVGVWFERTVAAALPLTAATPKCTSGYFRTLHEQIARRQEQLMGEAGSNITLV